MTQEDSEQFQQEHSVADAEGDDSINGTDASTTQVVTLAATGRPDVGLDDFASVAGLASGAASGSGSALATVRVSDGEGVDWATARKAIDASITENLAAAPA